MIDQDNCWGMDRTWNPVNGCESGGVGGDGMKLDEKHIMNPLEAYLAAYRIRRVELEISERYHPPEGEAPMRTPTHLSVGSEHVAVAVADAVPPGSHAYSTHRSHAHYLAWGGDLTAMVAELHGRATGCANGWGGSMHLIDEAAGFMGTSAIVGSSVSLAVGDAFARQLEYEQVPHDPHTLADRVSPVTVAFCGDAVPETGQFWEALNFAALKQLRLVIVIEDNGLATSTPISERQVFGWADNDTFGHDSPILILEPKAGYANLVRSIQAGIRHMQGPLIIRVPVPRMAVHVGPTLDDRVGEPGDPLLDMRQSAIDSMGDPPDVLEALEVAEAQRIGAIFDEMDNWEKHPWPTPTSR